MLCAVLASSLSESDFLCGFGVWIADPFLMDSQSASLSESDSNLRLDIFSIGLLFPDVVFAYCAAVLSESDFRLCFVPFFIAANSSRILLFCAFMKFQSLVGMETVSYQAVGLEGVSPKSSFSSSSFVIIMAAIFLFRLSPGCSR